MSLKSNKERRQLRHRRVRRKISGTAQRPRLAIAVTGKNMYVQLIDDIDAVTLVSASTIRKPGNNIEAAKDLGREAAEAAKAKGIAGVVVDRGGHRFHGRVKAIVDCMVEAGLVQAAAVKEAM
jgi:large subunit ribosomal protein L18